MNILLQTRKENVQIDMILRVFSAQNAFFRTILDKSISLQNILPLQTIKLFKTMARLFTCSHLAILIMLARIDSTVGFIC